jgi:hypothetical protein
VKGATGHINVARRIFDHPMFDDGKPLSDREAWLWLISNAAWRPMQIMVRNGRASELVSLDRGQLSFSRSYLCKAWHWTSEKRVRTFLNRLQKESMVDLQTGQLQTIIYIRNYGVFQNGGTVTGPANGPVMGQQWASNGPEEKNIISIKKNTLPPASPVGFDDWYAIYPRKEAKQAAKRAFNAVLKSGMISLPVLIERTRAYAAAKNWPALSEQERKYVPLPATWLNAGRYDDDLKGVDAPPPALIDPSSFSDEQWRNRLARFQDDKTWLEAWGPEPGKPGCLVPSHLLLTPVSSSKGAA